MTAIYIDTALLAVPNYAISETSGKELIERIIHFSELVTGGLPIDMVLASAAEDTLWSSNLGPEYEQIEQFLELMNLSHVYSVNDLIQRYQLLFANCRRAGCDEYPEVTKIANFQSLPELPPVAPTTLVGETQRVFTSAGAAKTIGKDLRVGSAFFSDAPNLYGIKASVLKATGHDTISPSSAISNVDAEVQTLTSLSDLIDTALADVIWRQASTAHHLHLAITLGALAILKDCGETPNYKKLKKFAIGSEFMSNLSIIGCLGSGKYASTLRDICSQIVADKCSRTINPFSLTGQHVREFDKAKAWRTHVTSAGLGLRLMHWEGNGCIEFANVDVKNDETIARGSPKPASSLDFSDVL